MLKTESWRVGVDRERLKQEIQAREEEWKKQQVGFLRYGVPQTLRDNWDIGLNKWQTY